MPSLLMRLLQTAQANDQRAALAAHLHIMLTRSRTAPLPLMLCGTVSLSKRQQ
jgi:hypothetical protein